MATPEIQNTYYTERMALYGITDAENVIQLRQTDISFTPDHKPSDTHGTTILVPVPIFKPHDKGIEIIPYSLSRNAIRYKKDINGKRENSKNYSIIRLEKPITKDDGSVQKYSIPKGQGTPPLIPPPLVDLYDKKQKIKTLYLTEGYFKAFKSCMHGLPCIGLVSITCMIDKETGKLYEDIIDLIKVCQVERVVWLTDADCRSITKDEITADKDLYKRVFSFYNSIHKFQELLSGHDTIKIYFAHVNEDLPCKSKGLDDLMIANPEAINSIVSEATDFATITSSRYTGQWFTKFYISHGLANVRSYFLINDVTQFYLHHVELRADLKDKKFKFNGTLWSYDKENGKCVIEIPKNAADYFRVGDNYYEYLKIPNRYGDLTETYHSRQKSTISDDHGKSIFSHIAKYKAFCNTPDHRNYQRVINNCFNTYHPFTHVPEEGDCDQTLTFIKHIFGSDIVDLEDGLRVPRWELGLDYLNILYTHPQQILPILCLVSKERETGKTTFAKWLKLLFTENMAIVGNNDFENAFNAHWITKLLVCVDETKIDKLNVVEKIKALSTSNHTMMNAKGKDQIEVETFLKFILLSNNEDNFINIDKEEIRFWVLSVPSITGKKVDKLEQHLIEEIPAFLNFLARRKMVSKAYGRAWFKAEYLRTDSLTKLQQNSAPTLWKILKARITGIFEDFDIDQLQIPSDSVRDYLLKGHRYEDGYIRQILNQNGYFLGKTVRGSFPRWYEVSRQDGHTEKKGISTSFHARCYTFARTDFTDFPISATQMEIPTPTPAPENSLFETEDVPF